MTDEERRDDAADQDVGPDDDRNPGTTGHKKLRQDHEVSFPLIAVGASAGGLEALEDFVDALPSEPGLAVVILSHGERSRESHLADILGKHTEIPIETVSDGLTPEANRIYVCPVGVPIEMVDGAFRLVEEDAATEHPIDRLFRSMADDQGSRVVGVVLSGALSDGTLGLREIHGQGGFTFAQEEATAAFPDMPGSAIASGCVDVVDSPAGIAEQVLRIGREPLVSQARPDAEAQELSEADLDEIFALVEEATGVDFSRYKRSTILRRIHRRIVATGANDARAYMDLLRNDPEEPGRLHDDSLIHVTGFFRDPEIYDALEELVFPELVEEGEDSQPIRVWVPGCSTGEEVYSLAIALQEHLQREGVSREVQIFGTDISETAIDAAREGRYPKSIEQDVSRGRLQQHFVEEEGGYRIRETVRNRCIFARQDVARDPPFSSIDLVSCRNLLIYMDPTLQERVAATLHYALKEDGVLVLGSAESVQRFNRLFHQVDPGHPVYRRSDVETPALGHQPMPPRSRPSPAGGPGKAYGSRSELDLRREADELALEAYAPPGVVIDENYEILQFRGDTGLYLSPSEGQASLNLMRMAPQAIAMTVRHLVETVQRTDESATDQRVRFESHGRERLVDLRVAPVPARRDAARAYLVSFEEAEPEPSRTETGDQGTRGVVSKLFSALSGDDGGASARAQQLEKELESTRDHLQTVVEEYEATTEELRSANEETLSTNEELQSTNEELETAKEELQSTNEELSTLNEELRERNEELQRLNDDLVNLLASVSIPIVMVGSDLRIRRFTPPAEDLMNLIDTDVGRPLTDLNHPFQEVDLEAKILEVLDSLQVVTETVEDEEGHRYELRVHPYRTADNKIEGAVLVFRAAG